MNQLACLYEDRFTKKNHLDEVRLPNTLGKRSHLTHINSDTALHSLGETVRFKAIPYLLVMVIRLKEDGNRVQLLFAKCF